MLLFFTVPLAWLPIAALSAILVNSALGLFDLKSLARLQRVYPQEFVVAIITLLGVITVGVLPGVVFAVGVAIVQVLANASHPHDALLGRAPGGNVFVNVATHPEAQTVPGLVIYRFDAALLFFNADHFKARVRYTLITRSSGQQKPQFVVLDAETMALVDTTGAVNLVELSEELAERDIVVVIAATKAPVRQILDASSAPEQIGSKRHYPSVAAAVESLLQM